MCAQLLLLGLLLPRVVGTVGTGGTVGTATRGPEHRGITTWPPPQHHAGLRGRALIHNPPLQQSHSARDVMASREHTDEGSPTAPVALPPPPPAFPSTALNVKQSTPQHLLNICCTFQVHSLAPSAQQSLKITTEGALILHNFRGSYLTQPVAACSPCPCLPPGCPGSPISPRPHPVPGDAKLFFVHAEIEHGGTFAHMEQPPA